MTMRNNQPPSADATAGEPALALLKRFGHAAGLIINDARHVSGSVNRTEIASGYLAALGQLAHEASLLLAAAHSTPPATPCAESALGTVVCSICKACRFVWWEDLGTTATCGTCHGPIARLAPSGGTMSDLEFYRNAWYGACEEFRKLAERCGVDTSKVPANGILTAVDAINARLDERDRFLSARCTDCGAPLVHHWFDCPAASAVPNAGARGTEEG